MEELSKTDLEEPKPLVVIEHHLEALVVDESEEAGVAEVVHSNRKFLQGDHNLLHYRTWNIHRNALEHNFKTPSSVFITY